MNLEAQQFIKAKYNDMLNRRQLAFKVVIVAIIVGLVVLWRGKNYNLIVAAVLGVGAVGAIFAFIITAAFLIFEDLDWLSGGQIAQMDRDTIHLKLVPEKAPNHKNESELIGRLRKLVGDGMKINVEYRSDMEAIKQPGRKFTPVSSKLSPF